MSIHKVIAEWANKPFAYGDDCCQFAAAVVEELTGHNPMRQFDYSDEVTALRAIQKFGRLEEAMRAVLGEPIPVDESEEGDVLLAERGHQMAGIHYKGRCVVKTKTGLTDWPLEFAKMAWVTCRKR